jgi:hypothetical protein
MLETRRVVRPWLEGLEDRLTPGTLTVTSAADDNGAGTLRALVAAAGSAATINFDPKLNGATITLTRGEIPITSKNLTIDGGAQNITIDGGKSSRLFDITGLVSAGPQQAGPDVVGKTAATLLIENLTLSNGYSSSTSGGTDPGYGGAIYSQANLTLTNDIFNSNKADNAGGAVYTAPPSGADTPSL